MLKKCSTCKTYKSLDEFPKNKGVNTGIGYECKECVNSRAKKILCDE